MFHKFIFTFFCLVTTIVFAQMSITDLNGTPFQDGESFQYDTIIFEDAKLKYIVGNSSATESVNILIEVVSFTNTDGTNCQLCVQPLCFFAINEGQTYPNNPITLAPGTNNGLDDYFANTNPGDGQNYPIDYVLRFYTVDDNGNETGEELTLNYSYSPPISTVDFTLKDLGIELQNTVVSASLDFNSLSSLRLKVYDLKGRLIYDNLTVSGENNIPMNNLSRGNYIVLFEDNFGKKANVKILKK